MKIPGCSEGRVEDVCDSSDNGYQIYDELIESLSEESVDGEDERNREIKSRPIISGRSIYWL